jgi:hypothetical protein
MKKFIFFATFMGLAIVALRRRGPTLGQTSHGEVQGVDGEARGLPGDGPCDELRDEPTDLAGTPA